MTRPLDGIEREIGNRVDLAIIWLHGLGADASDFVPIIGEIDLPTGTRFVFPNAPLRPVTINAGLVMRAWFDITGFGPDAPQDIEGLAASVGIIRGLVERERERGLKPRRIVLAGFSQGGAVALHAGLGVPACVGAVIGLSTYLPAPEQLDANGPTATDVPVWLAHGTYDPVIPIELAERSARALAARGVSVEWSSYPVGHEVAPAEIGALSAWLRRFASR